jgi:hypothetical protein
LIKSKVIHAGSEHHKENCENMKDISNTMVTMLKKGKSCKILLNYCPKVDKNEDAVNPPKLEYLKDRNVCRTRWIKAITNKYKNDDGEMSVEDYLELAIGACFGGIYQMANTMATISNDQVCQYVSVDDEFNIILKCDDEDGNVDFKFEVAMGKLFTYDGQGNLRWMFEEDVEDFSVSVTGDTEIFSLFLEMLFAEYESATLNSMQGQQDIKLTDRFESEDMYKSISFEIMSEKWLSEIVESFESCNYQEDVNDKLNSGKANEEEKKKRGDRCMVVVE